MNAGVDAGSVAGTGCTGAAGGVTAAGGGSAAGTAAGAAVVTWAGAGELCGLVAQPSGSKVDVSAAGAGGGGAFLKKLNIGPHFRPGHAHRAAPRADTPSERPAAPIPRR